MVARAIFLLLGLQLLAACAIDSAAAPTASANEPAIAGEASAAPSGCRTPDNLADLILSDAPGRVVTADLTGADATRYLAELATLIQHGDELLPLSLPADRVIGIAEPNTDNLFVVVAFGGCVVIGMQITAPPAPGEPI